MLSWIALRGRCRQCRKRIPIRYPALELGVGVAFGGIASLVRPLYVPMSLAVMTGVTALAVAWAIHRRLSRSIATVSAIVVIIAAFATAGVALLASR